MTRSECLKRSVECCRLADAASEPEMKVYLLRLALSWMQAATSADERLLELAAAYQQMHGGLVDEREAFARAGRAYLVVLVGSILLWVLIALAIFELFVALTG